MSDSIRFERAVVQFTPNLSVDGYRTPSGDFRVGLAGASTVLGFAKNWLGRVTEKEGKPLKALQDMGFTGYTKSGIVAERGEGTRGASEVSTISLDDFSLLILYAATHGKKEALALQIAFNRMTLTDFFRDAFGDRPLTMEEKRQNFYLAYAKAINWLAEDKWDINQLWLAGDPKELKGWNDSVKWI